MHARRTTPCASRPCLAGLYRLASPRWYCRRSSGQPPRGCGDERVVADSAVPGGRPVRGGEKRPPACLRGWLPGYTCCLVAGAPARLPAYLPFAFWPARVSARATPSTLPCVAFRRCSPPSASWSCCDLLDPRCSNPCSGIGRQHPIKVVFPSHWCSHRCCIRIPHRCSPPSASWSCFTTRPPT